MADLETVLYTRLANYAGLTALVSTRVYPLRLPQNPTLPAVTFQRITGSREHGMTADHGMAHPTLQVDSWGETYASARAVAVQVRTALSRWSDATTDPVVLDVFASDERDMDEADVKLFRVSQDYQIWHRE